MLPLNIEQLGKAKFGPRKGYFWCNTGRTGETTWKPNSWQGPGGPSQRGVESCVGVWGSVWNNASANSKWLSNCRKEARALQWPRMIGNDVLTKKTSWWTLTGLRAYPYLYVLGCHSRIWLLFVLKKKNWVIGNHRNHVTTGMRTVTLRLRVVSESSGGPLSALSLPNLTFDYRARALELFTV